MDVDTGFLLALIAFLFAVTIDPKQFGRKINSSDDSYVIKLVSFVLKSIGVESTFYILLVLVVLMKYPLLLGLALFMGKAMYWVSQYGTLPKHLYYIVVGILNFLLFGSLALKITFDFGWENVREFLVKHSGMYKKCFYVVVKRWKIFKTWVRPCYDCVVNLF